MGDVEKQRGPSGLVRQAPTDRAVTLDAQDAELARRLAFHKPRCSVCLHHAQAEIEAAYLGWSTARWICETYDITPVKLRQHVAFFRLDQLRAGSGEARNAVARLVETKLAHLQPEEIDAPTLLRALELLVGKPTAPAAAPGRPLEPGERRATWEERIE